jgi:hypothetical protein
MRANSTVLMVGKRGTGKTTLINDIMYHNRHKFKFGVAMSPTDDTTNALGAFIPQSCIYDDFNEGVLKKILEHQKWAGRGPAEKFQNMFAVLDDCAYDKKSFSNKTVREVYMNGRHRKLFYMNSVQYMMDMPCQLRGQIDYVFATRDGNISQREKLWRNFFGVFPDYKSFSKVFDECTNDYSVLVYDATVRSTKIEDTVFWYTASTDLPSFRLCDDKFWELDSYYYEEERAGEPVFNGGEGLVVNRLSR